MNLVIAEIHGEETYGLLKDNYFYEVTPKIKAKYPTLKSIMPQDVSILSESNFIARERKYSLNSINFLPPVSKFNKIICVGINYPKHYENALTTKPDNIIIFSKFHETLVGHNQSLNLPEGLANNSFDYEGEIAIVIGKQGYKITPADAMDYVFGYTLFNDGSVRDWQKHSIHSGKNFYRSSSCGPSIVTKDQVKEFNDLHLETRLNGKVVQSSSTKNMFFNINEILSYISNTIPLNTGDIIATGSPEGTGASQNPQRFLKTNDTLEFSASGLGVLKNSVTQK